MKIQKKRQYMHKKVAVEGYKVNSKGQPISYISQDHLLDYNGSPIHIYFWSGGDKTKL